MPQIFPERTATLLLTDMTGFTRKTLKMTPNQVLNFLIEYRQKLEAIILQGPDRAQYLEHTAGDASASVFEEITSDGIEEKSIRGFKVALRLVDEIKKKKIPPTRCGLYSGQVLEARINHQTFRFGNCFSAASRLQELCGYFDVPMLMDRNVALAQKEDKKYIACIGKITPKSLDHPIHVFTVYKPGVHKIPLDTDRDNLFEMIELKNQAMEYFHGNLLRKIVPDFSETKKILYQVCALFKEITGCADISSKRILKFITENNSPSESFLFTGIQFKNKNGESSEGVNLYRLARELLKALDTDFYNRFVLDTQWQTCFKFQWRKKGDILIKKGVEPDGVYFLTKGKVHVLDENNHRIATITQGNIFGEMAYFSNEGVRNASVTAFTDLELYFISGKNLMSHPEIRDLFKRIAQNRQRNKNRQDSQDQYQKHTAGIVKNE